MAGLTIARRLAQARWGVDITGWAVPPGRIVTLDESVVALLELEFGDGFVRGMGPLVLDDCVMRWRRDVDETVSAPSLVTDMSRIAAGIEATLPHGISFTDGPTLTAGDYDAVIDATGRSAMPLLRSGARTAFSWLLQHSCSAKRAFLGASDRGWMFVIPAPEDRLFVQAVVPGPPATVTQLWPVIADLLATVDLPVLVQALQASAPMVADATPIFSPPVGQDGVLRVGDRAAAGDPLAGDGVGRAVRSAVLAAAIVLDADLPSARSYGHYASRMAAAHATHLSAIASLYAVSKAADAFVEAIDAMREHARLLQNEARRLTQPIKVVARSDAVGLSRIAWPQP